MARPTPEDTTARWQDSSGALTFHTPCPGVVRQTVTGRASAEMGRQVETWLNEAMVRYGSLQVFDDWEAATGYESDVRVRLTRWTRTHHARVAATHVLVRSKVVSMGLSVAALVVQHTLHVYSERPPFEREYEAALARARGTSRAR